MSLEKFTMLSPRDGNSNEGVLEVMLINTLQIISIKPVILILEEKETQGYWIRTSNGKKYRAVEIPNAIKAKLD